MTEERINKLDAIDFDWSPGESKWNLRYELLQKYKKDKGNCRVPKSYAVDGVALGNWICSQRHEYWKLQDGKPSAMTLERINKLEALGFDWSPSQRQWNLWYELLQKYKKDKGNYRVPRRYAVDGVALGKWVTLQRTEYWLFQKGKHSRMTEERINKLDAIDFDWSPGESKWNLRYEHLQKYKKDNGYCRVPTSYAVDGVALGNWICSQRHEYRKLQDGKPSAVTIEQINKLEAVGFDWDPFSTQWNSTYELLRQYYNDNGDSLVPHHYTVDGVALGLWVRNQRVQYRKLQDGKPSAITQDRINKLEALGIDWSPHEKAWLLQKSAVALLSTPTKVR